MVPKGYRYSFGTTARNSSFLSITILPQTLSPQIFFLTNITLDVFFYILIIRWLLSRWMLSVEYVDEFEKIWKSAHRVIGAVQFKGEGDISYMSLYQISSLDY